MSSTHLVNNVHVSGTVIAERVTNNNVLVTVGINEGNTILPIISLIDYKVWEKFKNNFPDAYKSVTISGTLQTSSGIYPYVIKGTGISLFHNLLGKEFDETETQFHGLVKLRKKFDFDTASKLYLKRLIFETISEKPAVFEAMALRGAAPYFEEIQEGEEMLLKANYVLDKNGNPPYWRIKHQPQPVPVVNVNAV